MPRSRLVSSYVTMTDSTPRPTLQLIMRRLQDATSYWTGQQSMRSALSFIISKQLREKNYFAFLGVSFDASFQRIQHIR